MRNVLILMKGPEDLSIADIYSKDSVSIVSCIDAYTDFFRYRGYTTYSAEQFFSGEIDMKFDVIVGNPPYKVGGDKNYYVKFIKKSNELLKEGGKFSFIIPNRFLSPSSIASKAIRGWLDIDTVYPNITHHFPGVGTNIGLISGTKISGSSFKKVPFIFDDNTKIMRSLDEPTPVMNPSLLSTNIVSKVFDSPFSKMKIVSKPESSNYIFIEVAYCRYRSTTPVGGEKTLVVTTNTNNGIGGYIEFDSLNHAETNNWFLSRSKLGRFIVYSFANSSFATSSPIHHGYMPIIPNNINMNDIEIYNLFNINEEEIKEIESIMV